LHRKDVTLAGLGRAFKGTYRDLLDHHPLQVAAALSYYLVLSVFPALIFLSAMMASVPLPNLFDRVLGLMWQLLPADSMRMIHSVLADLLAANRKSWLSFGMIATIWAGTAAFDAMIEALDIAYDTRETRPWWKTRLLAIGLAAMAAALLLSAVTVMILGPRFGEWLAARIYLSRVFVLLWPVMHWAIAVTFTLVTVELLYFLAPNVKQRFAATLPGAILAVTCWITLSYGLGFYFRHIANYSRTYGTLAGFIAFMTWFYWNSLALLVGAELNSELAKESDKGQLRPKPKEEFGKDEALDRAA
jgi:membrane protein